MSRRLVCAVVACTICTACSNSADSTVAKTHDGNGAGGVSGSAGGSVAGASPGGAPPGGTGATGGSASAEQGGGAGSGASGTSGGAAAGGAGTGGAASAAGGTGKSGAGGATVGTGGASGASGASGTAGAGGIGGTAKGASGAVLVGEVRDASESVLSTNAQFALSPWCPPTPVDAFCEVALGCSGNAMPNVSAGTVTVSGWSSPVVMSPDATNHYSSPQQSPSTLVAGETITFSATGDVFPPFQGQVVTPEAVVLVAPVLQSPPVALDASQPMTVTWTGGGQGTLQLTIWETNQGPQLGTHFARCAFDLAKGSATISPAVLASFSKGKAVGVQASSVGSTTVTVAPYSVLLAVIRVATRPDGLNATGTIALQ